MQKKFTYWETIMNEKHLTNIGLLALAISSLSPSCGDGIGRN